jgi:GT2 family glycosyltransferase/glycosyltransferase involved in cell wall biosynthesis
VHVCTVINRAWVAHARALAESLRAHTPDARLAVLVVDPIGGYIDPAQEPFELLTPAEIGIEDFAAMSVRYGVVELCCALKPVVMRHLLARPEGAEAGADTPTVVYLDSDVRVYAPLAPVAQALAEHPFLLTPHLLRPLPDDGCEPSELAILRGGAHNLGFAAARPDPQAQALLEWWSERLRTGAHLDPARGMVYDQRWADLMPGIFEGVGLLRDPGVNFGYWRAAGTRFEREHERVLVDGHTLRCLHFTGFEPERPERLSRYDTRTSLPQEPVLEELCREFTERLRACGHAEASEWSYGFAAMASGAPLTPLLRELWDCARGAGAVRETPFTADGERVFLEWLAEPVEGPARGTLSRYLAALHAADPELRERFPDPADADREAYLAWAAEQAERRPAEVLGLLHVRHAHARRPGLRELRLGESLGCERGQVVVCIPVYGGPGLLAECLTSVLAHTPADTPILIADDASPDPAIRGLVESFAAAETNEHELAYLRQPENLGFPGNVNAAFAAAAPADVVVLNSDCVVAAGWLEGLCRAALSDELVATASALTNHGTILSVPERNRPRPDLPQDQDVAHAAGAVRAQSLRLHPRLPTAVGHCVYVRRRALDLVGGFDLAFSPGYGEEVDFSQRCALLGLVHVAADDVFVLHRAGSSLSEDGERNPVQAAHELIVQARYPYYERAAAAAAHTRIGPLPRALAAARRAIDGLTVTIDARCLGPVVTGTQVHTLEVIAALSHTGRVAIRAVVPPDLGAYAHERLTALDHVALMPQAEVRPGMDRTDVAHRPYQVSSADDLLRLALTGERQVITHQDLIAYRNPGYFPGYPQWERHRRLTALALAQADSVVFFSHHAAQDALGEDLVDASRVRAVYIGVDHVEPRLPDGPRPPAGAERLGERPMLLCLGADFRHKNRVFALRLLEALREERGWDGTLVLAGPRVSHGSSRGEEAAYLATRPELADAVLTLPAVGEAEKAWLLERCAAVLYPTTYEGFGLMPFEAAAHDRPCLFASQTALAETLPAELATLVPWDPSASAASVHHLLEDREACAAHLRAVRQAGLRFSWKATGEALVDVYWAAAASPAREATRLAVALEQVTSERDEAERKYEELWGTLTPDMRTLVGPGSPLPPQAQHSLAAVARRPLLRRLLLGPAQLAHRVGARSGQRATAQPAPEVPPETLALHFAEPNQLHMREQLAHGDSAELIPEP